MKRISLVHNPLHLLNHPSKNKKFRVSETRIIHAHFIKTSLVQSHLFVANSITDSYSKSGSHSDALCLLEEIPHPNSISWNLMLHANNQSLQFDESFKLFSTMRCFGSEPNQVTYGSILSACAATHSVCFGEQVYALVIKNGFSSDDYICTGMMDLFAKGRSFGDALRVFSETSDDNVVCWNTIIAGGVRNGEHLIALDLFHHMLNQNVMPNGFTFSSTLTACAALRQLEVGMGIHGLVIKCGVANDIFVGTSVIDFYAKCGFGSDAVKQFSQMPELNVVSWTAILCGFVQMEDTANALKLFREMRGNGISVNKYTLTCILTACAKPEMANTAVQLHCLILKSGFLMDCSVKDSLINMYARNGEIGFSEKVFEEVGSIENTSTWAVMICGFAQNEDSQRSIELFRRMVKEGSRPDKFSSSSVLSVVSCLELGKQIHSLVLKGGLVFDVAVGSALFTMYSKCGSLDDAYEVFEQMPEKDAVSWTSMIAGFAEHGQTDQAFRLFRSMVLQQIEPDQVTLSAILLACCHLESLWKGKEIHGYALRVGLMSKTPLCGAMVNMYSKCKALLSARRIFDMMPQKDQISCSSLVSGFAQNGYGEEAILQFCQMLIGGLVIDPFTISSVIGVSAILTRTWLGKQLHAYTVKTGLDSDLSVSSSLVTMYSKCGIIDDSRKVFDLNDRRDLFTWTAMIDGYAQHGQALEALKIYEMMRKQGISPDSVTFVGILSACSHNGLVEEGFHYLNSMVKDFGLAPEARHYACMVDLLGRSGSLEEASHFIDMMPIKPDVMFWGTLLSACRLHGNAEIGRLAAKKILELEPCHSGAYVSLSNFCADVGNWEDVLKIRSLMRGVGIKKEPGWSTV